jgi:PhnB protein
MAVKPIPEGFHTITPYLIVKGGGRAIDFYKRAFGAVEKFRMDGPDGKIGHAELRIGDSTIMLADENPARGALSPASIGGSATGLMIYIPDVDDQFRQAVEAGATVKMPVTDMFYGDRSGSVTDPFGHIWTLSTHKEDVPPDELARRAEAFMKKQA